VKGGSRCARVIHAVGESRSPSNRRLGGAAGRRWFSPRLAAGSWMVGGMVADWVAADRGNQPKNSTPARVQRLTTVHRKYITSSFFQNRRQVAEGEVGQTGDVPVWPPMSLVECCTACLVRGVVHEASSNGFGKLGGGCCTTQIGRLDAVFTQNSKQGRLNTVGSLGLFDVAQHHGGA